MPISRTDLENFKLVETGTGRAAILISAGMWAEQLSYNAAGRTEYEGKAKIGTGSGESAWSIAKLSYDGNNRMISKTWGSGTSAFDKTWNDRASYTYS